MWWYPVSVSRTLSSMDSFSRIWESVSSRRFSSSLRFTSINPDKRTSIVGSVVLAVAHVGWVRWVVQELIRRASRIGKQSNGLLIEKPTSTAKSGKQGHNRKNNTEACLMGGPIASGWRNRKQDQNDLLRVRDARCTNSLGGVSVFSGLPLPLNKLVQDRQLLLGVMLQLRVSMCRFGLKRPPDNRSMRTSKGGKGGESLST